MSSPSIQEIHTSGLQCQVQLLKSEPFKPTSKYRMTHIKRPELWRWTIKRWNWSIYFQWTDIRRYLHRNSRWHVTL